ncbi:MAG: DNA-binding ATP-dependent protease La [Syntrophorhabdaceae bacterium PtaU1.Bin034]|nr:MAG: DNA-binding ATP-dependent protease La [Syntrophorhabdaceae bacterium PtaU1.Bin034]
MTKLGPDDLRKSCNPDEFDFVTTDDIATAIGTIGQEKALKSLDFGLEINAEGFNIFALGDTGTGKMTTVTTMLKEKAAGERVPSDWCYVYNFKNPDIPTAISIEPGRGRAFRKDMDDLIKALKVDIPKAFESKEYEKQKSQIVEEFQRKQNELFSKLEEEAKEKGFSIKRGVSGILIVPLKKEGEEPLTPDDFTKLDEKTKKEMEKTGRLLQERLNEVFRAMRETEKFVQEMLNKLERAIAFDALHGPIDNLKNKYFGNGKIIAYLDDAREDILTHIDEFKATEEQPSPLPFLKMPKQEASFARFTVNVIVDHADTRGAPIVFESNPTYLNLFGRIENKIMYGMAVTDFTMIRGGSVHRANGGYLIVDALDLLRNMFSYEALKRAIKNREIKVEDVLEQYRLISTATIKPEGIPLDVKVVIVGTPNIYYLLYNLDPEYNELFKVKADFDSRMDRTPENVRKYANFIADCQKAEKLLPFDRSGVAKLVEFGSRLADHQEKLTTKLSSISDLMREAHYWAKKDSANFIRGDHVTRAIDENIYRVNRIEERIREATLEDVLIVDTTGEKVGQVNGLAVLDLGDYSFGKPSRITARTYVGKAGIVNIERETKMSGKIHEKAIFIIASYLGSKYAAQRPISLSASITFEQLYEMIEGDSATCAEMYSLLSSISGVPLKQSFAVTGSMDQNGDVQPIGGVNQKIEGFFDLCQHRGLDGSHGVIIPRRNVKNLMLKQEVIDALNDGKFSIYSIDKMEEGLEILTGMSAGEMKEDKTYPENTINYLVMKRLTEMSQAMEAKKEKEEEASRIEPKPGEATKE